MGKINILFQSFEITELTLIQDIRHVLDSVFILEVYFVGGALNGGVGTVRTVVRPHPGVSHLVPPQRVVVGAGVLAGVAAERFVPRVLPGVELQCGPGGSRVTTETAEKIPLLVVDGVNVEPQLPRGTEVRLALLTAELALRD